MIVKTDDIEHCMQGNHAVGEIARNTIKLSEWSLKTKEFEVKIADFNERGQRQQIAHPGWSTRFKYCPFCGACLADLDISNDQKEKPHP